MGPVSTFWTRGFWACSSNQWLPGLIACDQLQTIRGPGLSISRDDMGRLHFVFFWISFDGFWMFFIFFHAFQIQPRYITIFSACGSICITNVKWWVFHDKSDFPWFPSGSGGEGKNIQTHMFKKNACSFQSLLDLGSRCFKVLQILPSSDSPNLMAMTFALSWANHAAWRTALSSTASEHVENVMVQGCPLDTFQPKALRWRTLTNFVAPRPHSCY